MRLISLGRASTLVLLWCLLVWTHVTVYYAQEGPLSASVNVLKRWHLPDSVPPEIVQAHYVVLRLTLKNNGSVPVGMQPDNITLQAPKGKPLKPSPSSQVTSDILKTGAHKRSGPGGGIHGEAGVGYPRTYPGNVPPYGVPRPAPEPRVEPGTDEPGTLSAARGTRLREALEGERFRATSLEPGQGATGLLYFKVGKKAPELSGGTLVIALSDGKSISVKIH